MIVAFEFFDDMCEVDQCCCMCIKRLYEVVDGVCVSCVCVSLCVSLCVCVITLYMVQIHVSSTVV